MSTPDKSNGNAQRTPRKQGEKITPRKAWRKYKRTGNGTLLTLSELAKALGETERTIKSWQRNRVIPVIDLGWRTKRFQLESVMKALERRELKALA